MAGNRNKFEEIINVDEDIEDINEHDVNGDQLDEFKADGEDSSVADPVTKGSNKRRGDKTVGDKGIIKQGSSDEEDIAGGASDKGGQKGGEKVIKQGSSDEKSAVRGLKVAKEDIDVSDDIAALFNGEQFSEEFMEKAATIFQAAVYERVNSVLEHTQEQFDAIVAEEVEGITEALDSYLDVVVSEYVEENALAIERGVRSEIVESFLSGLKNLFIEHHVDIPEESVDIVDELVTKIEQMEEQANQHIDTIVQLRHESNELKAEKIIAECTDDLTDVQIEKLVSLAEGVDYQTDDQYRSKIELIKENYFTKTDNNDPSETHISDDREQPSDLHEEVKTRSDMAPYVAAIKRTATPKV